jgi:hypothetical protein
MKYEETIGKSVALLALGKDAQGKDEGAVFLGTIKRSGSDLLFVHSGNSNGFPLPDDALERIIPTNAETRSIMLNADLYIPVSIGPKLEGPEGEGMEMTGLKWPDDNNDCEPTAAASPSVGRQKVDGQ